MSGAGPLWRALDTATRPSCSPIPHLTAHIRTRQLYLRTRRSSAKISGPRSTSSRATARNISTTPTGRGFFDLSGAAAQAQGRPAESNGSSSARTPHVDVDQDTDGQSLAATVKVKDLLQERHPDRMLYALTGSHDSTPFIRTANDEDFTRALCALDPDWFLESYKPTYRRMSRALHVGPLYRTVRSLEDRFNVFSSCLKSILNRRREAGHRLTKDAYKHILKCAETMGDGQLARIVFDELILEDCAVDEIADVPDLECYNFAIAATAWSCAFDAAERTYNRRNHRNTSLREDRLDLKDSRPYPVLRHDRPTRPKTSTIRQYVMDLFRRLSEAGLAPNEKTFTGLMVALGQEGDMNAVNSILRSVWNIDLDLLLLHGEDEIQSPTYYEPTSPLYPTKDLLKTLVFVFANNNQVANAMTLMDYVARSYNITITRDIWMMLFEISFEFSSMQWGKNKDTTGQLDSPALERLYSEMTDIPHYVEPDASVMAMLATNASQRLDHDKALHYLREANRLVDVEKTELSLLHDQVLEHVRKARNPEKAFFTKEFLDLRHRYILQSLATDTALQEVIIAVRKVLKRRDPRKRLWTGDSSTWRLGDASNVIAPRYERFARSIPNMMKEFDTKLPNHLQYHVQSGTVEIENGYVHRTHAIELADGHFAERAGIVRQALDSDHHDYMVACLSNLEWKLHHSQNGFCPMCKAKGHGQKDCPSKSFMLAGHLQASDSVTSTPSHHKSGYTRIHEGDNFEHPFSVSERTTNAHNTDNKPIRKRPNISRTSDDENQAATLYSVSASTFTSIVAPGQHNHEASLADRWTRSRVSPDGTYRGKTPTPTQPLSEQQALLKGTTPQWLKARGLVYSEANGKPRHKDSLSAAAAAAGDDSSVKVRSIIS